MVLEHSRERKHDWVLVFLELTCSGGSWTIKQSKKMNSDSAKVFF